MKPIFIKIYRTVKQAKEKEGGYLYVNINNIEKIEPVEYVSDKKIVSKITYRIGTDSYWAYSYKHPSDFRHEITTY